MKYRIRSVATDRDGNRLGKGNWREVEADEPTDGDHNVITWIKKHAPMMIHVYPQHVGSRISVEIEKVSAGQQVPDYVGRRFTVNEGSDPFTIVPVLRAQSPHGTVKEINGTYRTLYLNSGSSFPLGNDADVRNKLRGWHEID